MSRYGARARSGTAVSAWLPPGASFSPLSYSPVAWYDASDATTITASGSPAKVSQWRDKSGYAYHLSQADGAAQPSTGTVTQNSLNCLDFDGGDYLVYDAANVIGKNASGLTIYYVRRYDSVTGGQKTVFNASTGTSNIAGRVSVGAAAVDNKEFAGGRTLDADSFVRLDSTNNVSTATFQVRVAVFDYANTDLLIYNKTTSDGSTVSFQSSTTTSNTDSLRLTAGSTSSFVGQLDGAIGEILIFNTLHGTTARQDLTNYLSSKWGL